MGLTVTEVIEGARDVHPLFSEQTIPPRTAVRLLDRVHKRIWLKTAESNPDVLLSDNLSSKQAFDTSTAAAGYALPSSVKYLYFYVHYDDGYIAPLNIVDPIRKGNIDRHPSAYIANGKLYPIDPYMKEWADVGGARDGWNGATSIEWHYIALPTTISAIKDGAGDDINLETPDVSYDVLVSQLAHKFGIRLQDRIGKSVLTDLREDATDATQTYLMTIADQEGAEIEYVQVVD